MTTQQKTKLYEDLLNCIIAFEEVDPGYMRPDDDLIYAMYKTLVKIYNNWSEL